MTFVQPRVSPSAPVTGAGSIAIISVPFNYQTTGLNTGVTAYVPNIGDYLLDAWFEIQTAFNGTGNWGDCGQGSPAGLFQQTVHLNTVDNPAVGLPPSGGTGSAVMQGGPSLRMVPAAFVNQTPFQFWGSTTGAKGGAPIGGTQGAGVFRAIIIRAS